jgi:hypothetical protein
MATENILDNKLTITFNDKKVYQDFRFLLIALITVFSRDDVGEGKLKLDVTLTLREADSNEVPRQCEVSG